jgi:hypothetical protein
MTYYIKINVILSEKKIIGMDDCLMSDSIEFFFFTI